MKKYSKRLIIVLLTIFSLVSLSSCAFFERALEKIGLGGDSSTEVESTTQNEDTYVPQTIFSTTDEAPISTKTSTKTKTSTQTKTSTTTKPQESSAMTIPTVATTTSSTMISSTLPVEDMSLEYGYNDLLRYSNGVKYQQL